MGFPIDGSTSISDSTSVKKNYMLFEKLAQKTSEDQKESFYTSVFKLDRTKILYGQNSRPPASIFNAAATHCG